MEEQRKRVIGPRIAATLSALMAGAALFTVSGSLRQGTLVTEYEAAADPGDSTIMIYMNGSDLEGDYGAATADIEEMINALGKAGEEGKEPSFHVVVEAGGSLQWQMEEMENLDYARFCLTDQGVSSMNPMETRNMGEPGTLADFINYGVQTYPADHYGLVLWNHGGGPVGGYGSDSNFGGDGLSLAEIQKAVEISVMADKTFDFVAFDACLMGSVEVAGCLEGKADYVIASAELEPQDGYNYGWMKALGTKTEENMPWGQTIGRAMVDAYETYYAPGTAPVTLSLLDMKAYPAFHERFHQYVAGIPEQRQKELYEEIGRARKNMLAFGNRQAGSFPELVDVMEFLNRCHELQPEDKAYEELEELAGRLVIECTAEGYPIPPSGLSIYLPSGSNPYLKEDIRTYGTTGFCSAYESFTDGYGAYLAQEKGLEWGDIGIKGNGAVEIGIASQDIPSVAGAYLAVFCPVGDDMTYYLLCTDSDVSIGVDGVLSGVPETGYMGLKGEILCLMETMNLEEYTEYMAPVLYNGELCTMRIGFDEEHEDGQILSLTPAGQGAETAKKVYELKEGDALVPLYPIEEMEIEEMEIEEIEIEEMAIEEMAIEEAMEGENVPVPVESVSGSIPQDRIYDDTYYMGTEFFIEEPEDMLLETVPAHGDGYLYGFMLVDVRQNIYYTDFISR